jgi:biotin operon repressor
MRYRLAIKIHEPIEEVLHLIETAEYSTPSLAEAIGVSIPTVSRIVSVLREQGHQIRAMRIGKSWRYVIPCPSPTTERSEGNDGNGQAIRISRG